MNILDLAKRIESEAGVADMNITAVTAATWFPGPNGQPTVIRHGQPNPFNDSMTVLIMFQDTGELRVYAIQTKEGEGITPAPPARYTLSKQAPTYVTESIPTLDLFVEEIATEIRRRVFGEDADVPDTVTCTKCESEEPETNTYCGACGTVLPVEIEDDPEPEDKEVPAPAPVPAVAGQA